MEWIAQQSDIAADGNDSTTRVPIVHKETIPYLTAFKVLRQLGSGTETFTIQDIALYPKLFPGEDLDVEVFPRMMVAANSAYLLARKKHKEECAKWTDRLKTKFRQR